VPLLLAQGAGAASRLSMGRVVVWGSLAATFVGIILTPALFVIVQKLVERISGAARPVGLLEGAPPSLGPQVTPTAGHP